MFNATFNNISLLSLLVEETRESTDLPQVTNKLYHIKLFQVLGTTYCDKVFHSLETGRGFFLGNLFSSRNKSDRHDITEILFNVALHTKALA